MRRDAREDSSHIYLLSYSRKLDCTQHNTITQAHPSCPIIVISAPLVSITSHMSLSLSCRLRMKDDRSNVHWPPSRTFSLVNLWGATREKALLSNRKSDPRLLSERVASGCVLSSSSSEGGTTIIPTIPIVSWSTSRIYSVRHYVKVSSGASVRSLPGIPRRAGPWKGGGQMGARPRTSGRFGRGKQVSGGEDQAANCSSLYLVESQLVLSCSD